MNLFTFMKKKQDKTVTKSTKEKITTSNKQIRCDTEAHCLPQKRQKDKKITTNIHHGEQNNKMAKKQKHKTEINEYVENTSELKAAKVLIQIKELLESLRAMRKRFQLEYENLLAGKIDEKFEETFKIFASTNFFRFRKSNRLIILEEYSNIIQSLELLESKLSNNQKLQNKLMIRNEQDFVLFFKYFFSKPYSLMNRLAVRKIIKVLWDQHIFNSFIVSKQIQNLRLWIYGIALPINPSMNKLHQLAIERPLQISKFINHRNNQSIYIGVNDSDALCLTPLMVAAIVNNQKSIEKLVKNGADIYACPFTISKHPIKEIVEISKYKKILFSKEIGIRERKQYDVIEILRANKKLEIIAEMLCSESYYKVKEFRKNKNISQLIEQIPECSFQIDWKEFKGMLSFKALPQDLITVYKKGQCLRMDFHVNSLQKWSKNQHFSILLKSCQQLQLWLISHHTKKIQNMLLQMNQSQLKQKFSKIVSYGNIYNQQIIQYKGIYFNDENRLSLSVQMAYQNVIKANLPKFQNVKEYINQIIQSQTIDYSVLQKSQTNFAIHQQINNVPKIKNKVQTSNQSFQIEWGQSKLNLTHLALILKIVQLAYPSTLLLNKIQALISIFTEKILEKCNFWKQLPLKVKMTTDYDLNLQAEIKNINYYKLDDSVFKVEARAKELDYEENENIDLSKLQETIFVDQMYSINSSRFLGKSQKLMELEENQANLKFQQLLMNEMQTTYDEDEDNK